MVKTQLQLLTLAIAAISVINASSVKSTELKDMIELSVTGDVGQNFIGDCYLLSKAGTEKRHRIKGQVPIKFWLPAQAARCHIQKSSAKGKMSASIIRNKTNEYTQLSKYPFRWLMISSAGPWGTARGGVLAARPALR